MTLCVAVMCNQASNDPNDSIVVGLCDRRLTVAPATPFQQSFEPNLHKFLSQTQATAAMIAGNTEMLAAVLRRCQPTADKLSEYDWPGIATLAKLYAKAYADEHAERVELIVLRPRNLTWKAYQRVKSNLPPPAAKAIEREIAKLKSQHRRSGDACLFVGLDDNDTGAHIYSATWEFGVQCCDHTGFWAVGSGAAHAIQLLRLDLHTHLKPFPEALLSAYSAKKVAEADPYVGRETDGFVIGPGLARGFRPIPSREIAALEKIYRAKASLKTRLKRAEAIAAALIA